MRQSLAHGEIAYQIKLLLLNRTSIFSRIPTLKLGGSLGKPTKNGVGKIELGVVGLLGIRGVWVRL